MRWRFSRQRDESAQRLGVGGDEVDELRERRLLELIQEGAQDLP